MPYSEQEIAKYLELAQEVGITRAKRELGYPASWATGRRWAEQRGIELPKDDIAARAADMREWYKDEEVIVVAQEGINRVYDVLLNERYLSADDQMKLSRAYATYVKDWLTVQGRQSSITETRQGDGIDEGLAKMLAEERAKHLKQQDKSREGSEQ